MHLGGIRPSHPHPVARVRWCSPQVVRVAVPAPVPGSTRGSARSVPAAVPAAVPGLVRQYPWQYPGSSQPVAMPRAMLKSDSRAAPVLHEFGSSGDHSWFCRAVVLERRASVAARPDQSWSFDQLWQLHALWRVPSRDWSGGSSPHSRP